MAKIEERHHARALRRNGLSFREIHAIVDVSKGTLNRWLKDIELTSEQKQPFVFMNSDPTAIRTMIEWLTRCADVPKEKIVASLQVHKVYADCGFAAFWVTSTGLPPSQFRAPYFKPTPHEIKKNPSHMGCCRLVVHSSDLFWRLRAWQEELVRYLGIPLSDDLCERSGAWTH